MWTERCLTLAACAALAQSAAAQYAQSPFHDRPVEVAERALAVFDGEHVDIPADDPTLAAAVAAMLLVSENGLAEAYEAAVEGGDDDDEEDDDAAEAEGDPYGTAFALLQDVRQWIAAIPADGDTRADIDDLLTRLDALLPSPDRPARLDADPEAAEVLAQALVGVLERAAGADLYLGRDLRRAIGTVGALAERACGMQDAAAAHRHLAIAALYHEDALEATLSVMAPDPAEDTKTAFASLLDANGDAAAQCADLIAAYAEADKALFPGVSQ